MIVLEVVTILNKGVEMIVETCKMLCESTMKFDRKGGMWGIMG